MAAIVRDTIPSALPDSREYAIAQIETSPGAADHAPHYVESVIRELRQAVSGARCPVHDCGPSLVVDFGSGDAGTVDVIAHNCCTKLDELLAEALRESAVFRLIVPR